MKEKPCEKTMSGKHYFVEDEDLDCLNISHPYEIKTKCRYPTRCKYCGVINDLKINEKKEKNKAPEILG